MDTLFSRHRNAMVLVAVLFLQLVLLAFQVKRDKDVPLIRIWAVAVITPVEKVASSFIRGVVGVWYDYADLRQARQENRRLAEELGRLKMSRHRLQEESLEARRLKELLQFRSQMAFDTVAARVIGSSASETSRVLFLDKGSEVGIRPNMPVITPDGIVGKVYRVFWGSSQVLVITDPDSGVGAMLESSRVRGALRGSGGFFCQMGYIVNEEKAEVGERVLTSGEDLIYPKGLPIGVVSSVKNGQVFKEIGVQPSAPLSRLEEVLVIVRGLEQEMPVRPEPAPGVAESAPGLPGPSAPSTASAAAVGEAARPGAGPLPLALDTSRARPETDADKLLQARRAAQAQKSARQKPAAAPAERPAVPTVGAGLKPAPTEASPKPAPAPPGEPAAAAPEKPPEQPAPKPPPAPQR